MELWNYGTKMTHQTRFKKKNAMNAPYVDGTRLPTRVPPTGPAGPVGP